MVILKNSFVLVLCGFGLGFLGYHFLVVSEAERLSNLSNWIIAGSTVLYMFFTFGMLKEMKAQLAQQKDVLLFEQKRLIAKNHFLPDANKAGALQKGIQYFAFKYGKDPMVIESALHGVLAQCLDKGLPVSFEAEKIPLMVREYLDQMNA